ncbi:uncharacterized protein A4U43_C05F16560 [Asparagus officinalis]|uniref:Sugar phosphate transporter domain-containing protein n=1 Tax=Asparagus officinalis TaxID=4686 RepID=A0A5P1EXG2_ASPOF|nr:uncharacterized protein A4U43_C05F16560 [Asparagus officinalis]
MSRDLYVSSVIPIDALYSLFLWFSNSAYVYLSVSFIQMLKALMPVAVYSLGVLFKKEWRGPLQPLGCRPPAPRRPPDRRRHLRGHQAGPDPDLAHLQGGLLEPHHFHVLHLPLLPRLPDRSLGCRRATRS